MLQSNKTSSCKMENNLSQDEASAHDESSSEQEQHQDIILNQSHVQQVVQNMFMPYIEDPKMDWTVRLLNMEIEM